MNRISNLAIGIALGALTLVGCGGSGGASSGGTTPQAFPAAIYFLQSSGLDMASMTDMAGANWTIFNNVGNLGSLTFDKQGRAMVTDPENDRIVRFADPAGLVPEPFGTEGNGVNQFNYPSDVAMDGQGRIYIADSYNKRIVRMNDMTGAGWTTLDVSAHMMDTDYLDITVDKQGRIYAAMFWYGEILRFDNMSDTTPEVYGEDGTGQGQFRKPADVQIGPDDKIYIADNSNHRIVRIDDMTGAGWVAYGVNGTGVGQFKNPRSISFDKQGRIYVLDKMNYRVVRMDNMAGGGWTSWGTNNTPEGGAGYGCNDLVVKGQ